MDFTPYLHFDGRCKQAFEFYAKTLGGKIERMQTYGESPGKDQFPAGLEKQIIHARLIAGKAVLMGSDAPPPHFARPQGFAVSIAVDKTADAERIFKALAEGGTVTMPIAETFWAARFGMLVDRFGIPWMVNCDRPA